MVFFGKAVRVVVREPVSSFDFYARLEYFKKTVKFFPTPKILTLSIIVFLKFIQDTFFGFGFGHVWGYLLLLGHGR